jgi:hypothetical protein
MPGPWELTNQPFSPIPVYTTRRYILGGVVFSPERLTFGLPTHCPTLLWLENRGWVKGRWIERAGDA